MPASPSRGQDHRGHRRHRPGGRAGGPGPGRAENRGGRGGPLQGRGRPGPPRGSAGIRCVPIDLAAGDVAGLPRDADYVVNFAVSKTNDWTLDLQANSGGLAWLMEHHQDATAFLHCSTTGVYKPLGHHVFAEEDQLGDNHGVWPFLRTYSISKIAAEATARWAAAALRPPHHRGPPVGALRRPGRMAGHPPRDDDQRQSRSPCTSTLRASTTRSTRTTSSPWSPDCWARPPPRRPPSTGVATRRSASRSGAATSPSSPGCRPTFAPTEDTIDSVQIDLTRMHELVGTTTVDWRDGMRRMVGARHPELLAD